MSTEPFGYIITTSRERSDGTLSIVDHWWKGSLIDFYIYMQSDPRTYSHCVIHSFPITMNDWLRLDDVDRHDTQRM